MNNYEERLEKCIRDIRKLWELEKDNIDLYPLTEQYIEKYFVKGLEEFLYAISWDLDYNLDEE